jgi:AI-2E family transporter
VPVVGSTIASVIVAIVALMVSLPVCLATIVFFVAFRVIEDYLLVPRIIGRAVKVPVMLTVVKVLLGGALQGIVGALVAIRWQRPCNCSSTRFSIPVSTKPNACEALSRIRALAVQATAIGFLRSCDRLPRQPAAPNLRGRFVVQFIRWFRRGFGLRRRAAVARHHGGVAVLRRY